MRQADRVKKEVKKTGYVPGTLITKANKAKAKRLSESTKSGLTKRDVAIRGLI